MANLPLLIIVHAAHVNVSRNAFFCSPSENWCSYCVKKQIEMWYIVVYTLIESEYASLLFPKMIFFLLLLHVEQVCKSFWKKSLTHTSSSFAQCSVCTFKLSTNLDKDFFGCLWYCGKKQIECGFAWSVVLSTTIRVVKICCETISSSDTSTKCQTASFKICPPAIITSPAEYDAILGQWEREDFFNHLSNYT